MKCKMQSLVLHCIHSFKSTTRITAIPAVHWASNYRRPQMVVKSSNQLDTFKETHFKQRTSLPPAEWHAVRNSLMENYKHITDSNIDTIVLGMCSDAEYLPLAKDYVNYLRTVGVEPKMASLGRLLRAFNAAYHANGTLTENEQAEVLSICTQLRGSHEMLDSTTCENLIFGLVTTPQWALAYDFLKMNSLSCTPSVQAYNEVIVKYFNEGHLDDGWKILEEMIDADKQPKCEIFIAYFKYIVQSFESEDFIHAFEQMLCFLEKHELIITEKVVNYLIDGVIPRKTDVLMMKPTNLDRLGKCNACKNVMQNIAITDEEFTKLSDSFLHKVLIRNDVFLKSTPEELKHFRQFIDKTAPYDCVIDGLNVAYSNGSNKPPIALAKLLVAVVRYFKERRKEVLILGRRHMKSWPQEQMKYITKHARMFLTNNLSQDDPFLLYATLKSGPSADFFSRDLMRSHSHLLDPEVKAIFRRWQQEHQYSLITQTQNGKILVKEPIRHRIYAHKVNSYWHLPYKSTYTPNPANTFAVADRWLCIKLQNSME